MARQGWRSAQSRKHPCAGSLAPMMLLVRMAGWRDHRVGTRDQCGMRDLARRPDTPCSLLPASTRPLSISLPCCFVRSIWSLARLACRPPHRTDQAFVIPSQLSVRESSDLRPLCTSRQCHSSSTGSVNLVCRATLRLVLLFRFVTPDLAGSAGSAALTQRSKSTIVLLDIRLSDVIFIQEQTCIPSKST